MNERNIEELLRSSDSNVVPEVVEERLDEVFREIRLEASAKKNDEPSPSVIGDPVGWRLPKRMLRFTALGFAALLLMGLMLTGLSLISPTFAQTLQRFPLLGTVYSDRGIEAAEHKGLIQSYPQNLESKDVPFGVRSIIYDGTRVVFDIYRKKSKPDGSLYDAGGVKEFSLYYKGEELAFSYGPGLDGSSVAVFDRIEEIDPPEKFSLMLEIETTKSQTPYEIELPVEMNTTNTIIKNPETPEELKKYGISIEKITLTPITTQVLYRELINRGLPQINFDTLIDERAREYSIIGGHGEPLPGNEELLNSYTFEPLREGTREVTLRFSLLKDWHLDRTIDMTVPIPAAVPSSQSK